MAKRKPRPGPERPRRRVGVFSLAILAVLGAAGWMAPAVLVHTSLRDRPLAAALAGIDGTISSRGARWSWLSGVEYRDIVLADRGGTPAVIVPSLVIEKGLVSLAADPRNLGAVRLSGVEAVVVVRPGGSSLEDILAPWLAAAGDSGGVAGEIELVGGTVELVDTARQDAWRVSDLIAAGTLAADGSLAGWTAAGRVRHTGRPQEPPPGPQPAVVPPSAAAAPARLDRTTIPAAAAAALAREGGWSVSAPAAAADGPRSLAVSTHRLPLGISSVAATRFAGSRLVDGLADLRLDVALTPAATEISGRAVIEKLAVCSAATLAEEFAIPRCELPLDVVIEDDTLAIRTLRAISPVFEAEASGRVPLVADDPWQWLEAVVAGDCGLAARIDLAAVAHSLPGGLAVRPDVQVTGGSLDFTAVARADGADRVLELKLAASNLAAVRRVRVDPPAAAGDPPVTDRQLRWTAPFTAWVKGRRGPGREAGLRIEEAQLASPAAELSATGTPAALRVQWTADLGGLVDELAEVLDLGGVTLAGKVRGRLDAERAGGGTTAVKLAASIGDYRLAAPDRPTWRDDAIAIDADLIGSLTDGLAAIDRARGMVTAAGDSLEVTLAGGVLVDTGVLVGSAGERRPWLRPAAAGGEVSADCSLAGDLGRWHTRLAAAFPAAAVAGLELGGSVTATAAVTPEPAAGSDAWRITKASGEVELFAAAFAGRRAAEPRIVATAAGIVRPLTGQIEISSAEVLSSSLSVRSGGIAWLADGSPVGASEDLLATLLERIRGRIQWQADLARLEDWVVAADAAADWPLSGRVWGTLDVAETQLGTNLVAEASGSQVVVARRAGDRGEARPVWTEPQAMVAIELTRPFARTAAGRLAPADRIVIDRVALESSTVAVSARGGIEDWSGRRRGELTGSLAYDWAQLSNLATPWTGGRIRLAGAVNRPFAIRGDFRDPAPAIVAADRDPAAAPAPGTLPLPEAWLAATRGGDEPPGRREGISLPVTAAAASRRATGRIANVSLETSAAWDAADLDGFRLAAGEVAIRLVEGQLAIGPFDIPAAGGRLRAAPWWRISPPPGEVVVPPGRLVDRVQLSGDVCRRLVGWISPLLAETTDTSAVVSVDVAGARLPVTDAFAGAASAQVVLEAFEVRPSGLMQPLVNLLGKLQAAVDPRFALSDTPVVLRVRPEPIRLRLAERRIWHDGLVLDSGPFTVTSRGSVAADGSLAMLIEVALRGDLAGQTPVLAQLLRTPIAIPLKGTLSRPQFDAGAIDVTVKRILENTARAVVDDGIGRGLEALFGRPSAAPPGPPAPLVLPR